MKRILVIDDELYLRNIIRINLEKIGYTVTLADDTYEAENHLEMDVKYDLIITDIMMPGRNGLDFIEILIEKFKIETDKILILSARKLTKDIEVVEKYNLNNYLLKPFKLEELKGKIEKILKNDL